MQTFLSEKLRQTSAGARADAIIRKCVHCGFCNVTCPSYQVELNELDGPRGRIYLIKQALEQETAGPILTKHLDRCLTCRNCETTCPAGVQFGELLDIGRGMVEETGTRSRGQRLVRGGLLRLLPYRRRFRALLALGRWSRPVLPTGLARMVPPRRPVGRWPGVRHARRVLLFEGCVQPDIDPDIDRAAARVLDRLGISLSRVDGSGCCGAMSHHMGASEQAKRFMRANIDACWDAVEQGAEAILSTATGCGVTFKDYGRLLAQDPDYATKAARVSALTKDLSELLSAEDCTPLAPKGGARVAYQPPCTLQHGQGLSGIVEQLLKRLGVELLPVTDAHLCCGAAGTYSLLQPRIAQDLGARKLNALLSHQPDLIVTGNIGCQTHLQGNTDVPVRHWIHLLDAA